METTELLLRIFVAALLGGIIGIERNYRAKEAGFRTHFLVSLGSAVFMIISQHGFGDTLWLTNISLDPSRIASQVVTGIGFIGAGTIIFQKNMVKGLTTAAGLWVTSAIGLACGAGQYVLAGAAGLFVLICLEAFNFLIERIEMRTMSLTFTTDSKEEMTAVIRKIKADGMAIASYKMEERREEPKTVFVTTLEIRVRRSKYDRQVLYFMDELSGVTVESIE